MQHLAMVLARGGSKRIPRKNAAPFRGQALLAWPIQAAKGWPGFSQVVISTDCPSLEALAIAAGAQSLGLRSPAAASDGATTDDAVLECLRTLATCGELPEFACAMYGSSVFIRPHHLAQAERLLRQDGFDLVFPVVRYGYPIWRALQRMDSGQTDFIWPEHRQARSQDLGAAFHDAGQFYFFRTAKVMASGSLTAGRVGTFEIQEHECHDIDNPVDLEIAEIKHMRLYPQAMGTEPGACA